MQSNNKKINILHLIYGLQIGGAEIALYHYINALGVDNYKHIVYVFGTDGPVRKKISSLGVKVVIGKTRESIKYPFRFLISSLALINDLKTIIRREGIQIIHSHSGQANQLGVILGKLTGIPTFPTIHSTMAFVDLKSFNYFTKFFKNIINIFIYRMATIVLCVSSQTKEIIIAKFNLQNKKVKILKNGIVINENQEINSLEQNSVENQSDFHIIGVGRLVPSKSFHLLIHSSAKVLKVYKKNIYVKIVGDGSEKDNLQKLISDYGIGDNVKLLGQRNDVIKLLKSSNLFVLPSQYEGLSIAMIEAMACGLPILASDSPGLREFINIGYNGFIFKNNDIKELSKLIYELAIDKALMERLSIGSKQTFKTDYNMRKNIKNLEILYKKFAK